MDATDQSQSTEPFTYVIIPLICIFLLASIATILYVRRRRHHDVRYQIWPRSRMMAPDGNVVFVSRGRRNPWAGMRSEEGLNELGEAPPPYEGKKTTNDGGGGTELGDVEQGRRPPEYIAEPPPAVVTDAARSRA